MFQFRENNSIRLAAPAAWVYVSSIEIFCFNLCGAKEEQEKIAQAQETL